MPWSQSGGFGASAGGGGSSSSSSSSASTSSALELAAAQLAAIEDLRDWVKLLVLQGEQTAGVVTGQPISQLEGK